MHVCYTVKGTARQLTAEGWKEFPVDRRVIGFDEADAAYIALATERVGARTEDDPEPIMEWAGRPSVTERKA